MIFMHHINVELVKRETSHADQKDKRSLTCLGKKKEIFPSTLHKQYTSY